jgi:chloramphenicol 3-O phosphotransferase
MGPRESVEHLLEELVSALALPGLSAHLTADPVRADEIVGTLHELAATAGRCVEWVAINNRRVDATVVAAEREWRIVCSIDGAGVHSASAFERPAPFDGVPGGRAVILTGPSSAGKTTVMQAVLDVADTPWVVFDELSFGTVAWPFLIWPDRSPKLRAGFIAGITALAAAGNQVILTGGGAAGSEELQPLIGAVPTLIVGLDCPLETRVARQLARDDRWGGLTEESDDSHRGWTLDVRFDTSALTADDVARRILQLVGNS